MNFFVSSGMVIALYDDMMIKNCDLTDGQNMITPTIFSCMVEYANHFKTHKFKGHYYIRGIIKMARTLHIEKRDGKLASNPIIWADDFTIPDKDDFVGWMASFGGSDKFDDVLKSAYAIKTRAENDPRKTMSTNDKFARSNGFDTWIDLCDTLNIPHTSSIRDVVELAIASKQTVSSKQTV